MPFYHSLKYLKKLSSKQERARVAKNILTLKNKLEEEIPKRTVSGTLLLATWNIRDFDSNKFRNGPRCDESFFYIAEVISSFDLVAIQEVNEDLRPLQRVLEILGRNWDYIVTDITEGSSGNGERMAFLFDKNKITFQKIAGEIVLPKNDIINKSDQFARSPFAVAFQSGWFKFMLCTVHIFYGADSGDKLQRRINEINAIAKFLSNRADKDSYNYILLGDFNIVSPKHETMKALEDNGFQVPEPLQHKTNAMGTKYYDQIGFKVKTNELQLGKAGVFNYYNCVFKKEDFEVYKHLMNLDTRLADDEGNNLDNLDKQINYYNKKWKTWQMSDHLPLWVELKIDFSRSYLEKFVKEA